MSFFLFCEYQSLFITTSGGATGHGQVVQPENLHLNVSIPTTIGKMKYEI